MIEIEEIEIINTTSSIFPGGIYGLPELSCVIKKLRPGMQNIALKAAADALRAELDFIQGTRSWKVTAPLRKMKGRGAS